MTNHIWEADVLGRREDADFLISYLVSKFSENSGAARASAFVLNLDAPWGGGKTFFLTRLKRQLESQDYTVAYVNAWEDDHADDPLISLISDIDEVMKPHLGPKKLKDKWDKVKTSGLEIAATGMKHAVMSYIGRKLGDGFEEVRDLITNAPTGAASEDMSEDAEVVLAPLSARLQSLLDEFRKVKAAEVGFRDNLRSFLAMIKNGKRSKLPFFILIDELDRCRPTYAVEMLERVKHLFAIENVVFVLATDTGHIPIPLVPA